MTFSFLHLWPQNHVITSELHEYLQQVKSDVSMIFCSCVTNPNGTDTDGLSALCNVAPQVR